MYCMTLPKVVCTNKQTLIFKNNTTVLKLHISILFHKFRYLIHLHPINSTHSYMKAFFNSPFNIEKTSANILQKLRQGPYIKYVHPKGEGGGQDKSVHVLFL